MRKWIIAFVTVVFLGLGTSEVLACGGGGYDGGYTMGWGQGGHMMGGGYGSGNYSQGYFMETAALRQELAAKRGEYDALMANPDHDSNRAAQLSEEIASLQDQLQARSQVRGYMGPGARYKHGRW